MRSLKLKEREFRKKKNKFFSRIELSRCKINQTPPDVDGAARDYDD